MIKRLLLLFILLQYLNSSVCQKNNDSDSLKKYSYLLALCVPVGNSCNLSGMSTGFLIKDHNDVYLVSAYHVFTSTNTTSNKPVSFLHKGMLVRIENKQSEKNLFINLQTLKEWGKKISLYATPDIYFYKTKINPDSINIYSVENILKKKKEY